MARPTGACDGSLNSGYGPLSREEGKPVKRKTALALASSFAALTLAACSTMPGMTSMQAATESPPANTVTGRYLAAKFAASAGDVKNAATYYAETLKEDPTNTDLLVRAFMYAAESGDI